MGRRGRSAYCHGVANALHTSTLRHLLLQRHRELLVTSKVEGDPLLAVARACVRYGFFVDGEGDDFRIDCDGLVVVEVGVVAHLHAIVQVNSVIGEAQSASLVHTNPLSEEFL